VAKAQVLDTNNCQNIRYYNVHLAIAPDGGGLPSALLKRDLAGFLERHKVISIEINLFDPIYRPVDIDAEVYAWPGEALENVRSRIEYQVSEFFAFDLVSFGQAVHQSDLVALVDGVRGVSHLNMYAPGQDIELRAGEIPVLGNVNLDLLRAE